jgi:hypothetical protein
VGRGAVKAGAVDVADADDGAAVVGEGAAEVKAGATRVAAAVAVKPP